MWGCGVPGRDGGRGGRSRRDSSRGFRCQPDAPAPMRRDLGNSRWTPRVSVGRSLPYPKREAANIAPGSVAASADGCGKFSRRRVQPPDQLVVREPEMSSGPTMEGHAHGLPSNLDWRLAIRRRHRDADASYRRTLDES